MNKIIDNEHGVWKKTIVNPDETLKRSGDVISYASDQLKEFDSEKRVITSMTLTVNYCNTNETSVAAAKSNISKIVEGGLIVFEEYTPISIGNDTCCMEYTDTEDTIREKIIKYLDIIVSRGMLNRCQCDRFVDTLQQLYDILTGKRGTAPDVFNILKNLDLGYELKYFPPTVACPDEFFKLIKAPTESPVSMKKDDNNARDKIDAFMKKWFMKGGKIYDKERDEFYTEFMTMYESINPPAAASIEDGVIVVARRSKPNKVMGMKRLMNYADINKILEKYNLNYHITYQQEHAPSEDRGKRRNSLSLKDNAKR